MDSIMVVNSNNQQLEMINKYLTQAGYTVFTSDTGAGAIAKARLFGPDLILVEASLNDMSGYDICKRIKNNDETQYILVAPLSDLDSHEEAIKAVQAGADDFLTKTFDPAMLITKVKSMLRIKHLSDQLKLQYAEIQEKNRVLDFELKMAMDVQRSMIQEFDCTINGVSFLSKYMPAMDVGGDFYDIIRIDDSRIAVIMGDVSGHGISAALLTSMTSMMIKTIVPENPLPSSLLEKMNNDFCNIFSHGVSDVYACVFYALIDTKSKTIIYSNAGLAQPYYTDSKNNSSIELISSGIPIGLLESTKYESLTIEYSEGDILFLQTDGLQDVFYKEKPEEYSQKLRELLSEFQTAPSKELLQLVIDMFYKLDLKDSEKYEIDDVSIIICHL